MLARNLSKPCEKGLVKELKESVKGFEANFKEFKLAIQGKCICKCLGFNLIEFKCLSGDLNESASGG